MKESYGEDAAHHTGPESCLDGPRGSGEALTGESTGELLNSKNTKSWEPRRLGECSQRQQVAQRAANRLARKRRGGRTTVAQAIRRRPYARRQSDVARPLSWRQEHGNRAQPSPAQKRTFFGCVSGG
jgi:hypothetical protein